MEIEDKRTVFGECSYRLVPQRERAERVPDARLDRVAERLKENNNNLLWSVFYSNHKMKGMV